jgi:hypothetical protein
MFKRICVIACAGWAILAVAAGAAEEKKAAPAPGKIAELWVFWPKDGHAAEFENAAKAHLAWRKQAGETYTWTAYQPIVGDDLTHYVYRSGEHQWADLDANAAWEAKANAQQQYEKDMGPHVARVEHYFTEADLDHSLWHEGKQYRYLQVEQFQIKPGGYAKLIDSLNKIQKAAVDGKWPNSYAIAWTTGGTGGMTVVFPYESYAAMQEPDPPFMKVLATSLGSEDAAKAAMQQLNESFAGASHTTIYTVRPDLSTPK